MAKEIRETAAGAVHLSQDDVLRRARRLNGRLGTPAHASITQWLGHLIDTGVLPPGQPFPAERPMAQALGVSRMTLRQSLATLRRAGRVATIGAGAGSASVVTDQRAVVDLSNLNGLRSQVLKSAKSITTQVIEARTLIAEPRVAESLQLPAGSRVHEIIRRRIVEGVPVVLEDSFFPADLCRGMLDLDLEGSLYDVLREQYDLAPFTAREEICPVDASAPEVSLFGVNAHIVPLLQMIRTAWSRSGTPVEYSVDLFRMDNLRLVVTGHVTMP